MTASTDWVLLAYRLPREPSTPRITLWRKLRRLGASQVVDGLVTLPRSSASQEQLDWLADDILEAGGEATVWFGRPGSRAQERALAAKMAARIAEEYATVIAAAQEARQKDEAAKRRTLARLRRALRAIRARDYFPPPERGDAERAVEELATLVEAVAR
jgi:hypothetical protein